MGHKSLKSGEISRVRFTVASKKVLEIWNFNLGNSMSCCLENFQREEFSINRKNLLFLSHRQIQVIVFLYPCIKNAKSSQLKVDGSSIYRKSKTFFDGHYNCSIVMVQLLWYKSPRFQNYFERIVLTKQIIRNFLPSQINTGESKML